MHNTKTYTLGTAVASNEKVVEWEIIAPSKKKVNVFGMPSDVSVFLELYLSNFPSLIVCLLH